MGAFSAKPYGQDTANQTGSFPQHGERLGAIPVRTHPLFNEKTPGHWRRSGRGVQLSCHSREGIKSGWVSVRSHRRHEWHYCHWSQKCQSKSDLFLHVVKLSQCAGWPIGRGRVLRRAGPSGQRGWPRAQRSQQSRTAGYGWSGLGRRPRSSRLRPGARWKRSG